MQANRSRDTKPEMRLRSLLHRKGLRFRVDIRPVSTVARRADVVFPSERVAVFVDGCYWHGCPLHVRFPRTNAEYWHTKIERNRRRDNKTRRQLRRDGFHVMRVWEHDLKSDRWLQRLRAMLRRIDRNADNISADEAR